jgi:hypothetical protein
MKDFVVGTEVVCWSFIGGDLYIVMGEVVG